MKCCYLFIFRIFSSSKLKLSICIYKSATEVIQYLTQNLSWHRHCILAFCLGLSCINYKVFRLSWAGKGYKTCWYPPVIDAFHPPRRCHFSSVGIPCLCFFSQHTSSHPLALLLPACAAEPMMSQQTGPVAASMPYNGEAPGELVHSEELCRDTAGSLGITGPHLWRRSTAELLYCCFTHIRVCPVARSAFWD